MTGYPFSDIEKKWQAHWEATKTFRAVEDPSVPRDKRKYVLDMFPYPSAAGLHVGHPEGYIATDIYCRYLRMKGYSVLHPMGFDSFGLPAENYAIKTGTHPRASTEANIARFKTQIKSLGFSYDWDRCISTCEPEYYRWTQWIFLKLFEKGLAYEAEVPINWCPSCLTGLANEEVKDGLCDRCGTPVTRRNLRQWILRITAYAERLLADLDLLDWSESLKLMQRNWIGRSEGANVRFPLEKGDGVIEVYTTRPDTLFGATYMVLAPEHPLVATITTPAQKKAVEAYIQCRLDEERHGAHGAGEGQDRRVHRGVRGEPRERGEDPRVDLRLHPHLLRHGGHHGRARARPARLRVRAHVRAPHRAGRLEERRHLCPGGCRARGRGGGQLGRRANGLPTAEFKQKITAWLEEKGIGRRAVNYKLRDWIFSRQSYWGEPIPLVHCPACGIVAVPYDELPAEAARGEELHAHGHGREPACRDHRLGQHDVPEVRRPGEARDQHHAPVGGLVLVLPALPRSPTNETAFAAREKIDYWMPVDLYVGGAEHAVLHLLYARFWHKFLFDLGVVNTAEPFMRLINQGMILGEGGVKMSKSLGNVINPDDIISRVRRRHHARVRDVHGPAGGLQALVDPGHHGREALPRQDLADGRAPPHGGAARGAARAPAAQDDPEGQHGHGEAGVQHGHRADDDLHERGRGPAGHAARAVGAVRAACSRRMRLTWPRSCGRSWAIPPRCACSSGRRGTRRYTAEETVEMVFQINGKIRAKESLPAGLPEAETRQRALANERIRELLQGKEIRKVIVVPNKLVNIVAAL